ncbi:MAG: hypothetical protein DRJ05_14845 [Bacteroidetes bacterium]|nr:MAG: hypothetical protein DRJ05_14845 [Bacteroidota bacterium]
MNKTHIILIIVFPLFCFSQDTIEVEKYHDNKKIGEVYTISLPDSSKNGDYKRFHKNGSQLIKREKFLDYL